jgi:hypothetical protein
MSLQIPAHLLPLTRDAQKLKRERPPSLLQDDQWNCVEAVSNLWVRNINNNDCAPPVAKKRRLVEGSSTSVQSVNGLSPTAWDLLMPWQRTWLENALQTENGSSPALRCFYEDTFALMGQDTVQKQELLWEVKRPYVHFLLQHCGVGKTWTFLAYIHTQLPPGEKALIVAKGLRSDIREIWAALGGNPDEILELQANRSCDKFLKTWADPRWRIIVMPATSFQNQMEHLDMTAPNPAPKSPAILVLDEAHEKANLVHAVTGSQTWIRPSQMHAVLLVTASRENFCKNWFGSRSILQTRSDIQRTPLCRCALVGLLGATANGQWRLPVPPMPVKPALTMLLPTLTVTGRLVPQEDLDEALLSMLPQYESSSFLDGTMGQGDCYATPAMERILLAKMDTRRAVIQYAHKAKECPRQWSKLTSSLKGTEVEALEELLVRYRPLEGANDARPSMATPSTVVLQKVLAEEHFAVAYAVLQHYQDRTVPLPSLPDCPVCMTSLTEPPNIMCICVPCCHLFCTTCLENSLSKSARSCPSCRTAPCGLLPLDRPLTHKKHVCLAQDLKDDYGKRVIIIVHGNRGAHRLHKVLVDTDINIKVWPLTGSSRTWEKNISMWREAPAPNGTHVLLVPLHSEHKEVAGVNLQMANKLIFMTTPELGQERLMQVLGRVIRPVKTPHHIDIMVYHNDKEKSLDELKANIQKQTWTCTASPASPASMACIGTC